jgi:hypothetical protein
MSFNDLELKRIEKEIKAFIEKRRPPVEIRDKVDLNFRIEKYNIFIFEIRPRWNNPAEKIEESVAKATYVKAKDNWKIFWQRCDMKWHKYEPASEVKTIGEFLSIVDKDQDGCFWG